jgi:antirestriction protein ArdC
LAQMMICAELGIEDCDFTNGAAYLAHWLKKLRDDKKEIFRAAADAQRIADYLLGFYPDYATRGVSPDMRDRVAAGGQQDEPPFKAAA